MWLVVTLCCYAVNFYFNKLIVNRYLQCTYHRSMQDVGITYTMADNKLLFCLQVHINYVVFSVTKVSSLEHKML